ncbi:leguminosin proline-rich group669 secreted peptide [Medicago truncatula]|uniref:Leguminosin proline-rich group669 secreted peptide n=1 Tax=Medicago truncatula TaxID=3880 RepID=A0A072VIF1_MEDTR|nr:leguminosin proline-rich group669 secreted peptide [Medicago truncatula]
MSYYYHVSVLVLFLAIITLTNIAGNPKYQIHAQTDGPIIYQQPTTDTQRPIQHFPRPKPLNLKSPPIQSPGVPHLPPKRPIRPPPMNIPAV